MKNKIVLILMFIVLVLGFITGCGSEEGEKIKKQAKENAVAYIKEKYGFKAKVSYAVNDYSKNEMEDYLPTIGELTGYSTVSLWQSNKNKSFDVHISGTEKTKDGVDDYQYEEIKEDIVNQLNKDLNIPIVDIKLYYSEYGSNTSLINVYYDKSNLDEVIKDNLCIVILLENYSDLKELESKNITLNYKNILYINRKAEYTLKNYDSYSLYNLSKDLENNRTTLEFDYKKEETKNLKDYLYISKNKVIYHNFEEIN